MISQPVDLGSWAAEQAALIEFSSYSIDFQIDFVEMPSRIGLGSAFA
jgi:hypothetical protein